MKFIKIKIVLLTCLTMATLGAQEKVTKVSQSFKVDKDVVIDLNTSQCNIVFDTWNKNEVSIESYVESDVLTKKELEEVAKTWRIDIDGSTKLVSINTSGGHASHSYSFNAHGDYSDEVQRALQNLKFELADLPDLNFDFGNVHIMELPEMPEIPEVPELPELPELPEGAGTIAFDYEAYKKDGDTYLEKWSEKFESKYGEDYAKKMEAWGEKFGEAWSERFGKDMEAWGEKFGEAWGEKFGEKMEAWGERFAAQMERKVEQREKQEELRVKMIEKRAALREKQAGLRTKMAEKRAKLAEQRTKQNNKHSHLKKTIIIKMPKKGKVKADVRHGELEFASILDDVQADLSHTIFKAEGINGSSTSINAAYAPVYINNWNLGELNLNHVKQAELTTVKHVILNCTSSNVTIGDVMRSAIIDSNIGDVKILNVADTFTNLNFILQNNKAYVLMPDVDYNMNYRGTNSYLEHPNNTSDGKDVNSFSMSNSESNKTVTVNAKYSKVIME
ncbi:hypothetical protein ACKGJY_08400 [Hyunsoonleella sp. 2307UL5-6]|uniref:hypothetical protein n=1 Tax=Hyunsoonleella sp. 2307UL5-6 TaxID=3384768 RepID=UPI0039BD76EB